MLRHNRWLSGTVNNSQDECREILFNVPTIHKGHLQQVEEKTEEYSGQWLGSVQKLLEETASW